MAKRLSIDAWQRIEIEYCAGEDSIREIADRFEISDAAIRKRAKAEGWVRKVRTANRREPARSPPPPAPLTDEVRKSLAAASMRKASSKSELGDTE